MQIPTTRKECEALDCADPLRGRRDQFVLPEGVIYLDGHSLGPPTVRSLERVREASMREWAQGLIRSWNDTGNDAGWIDLPLTVGGKLAQLIGAKADEVVVTDSVSVNLFKLASAALGLARTRAIIVEETEFPTDQYVAEGVCGVVGARLVRVGEDEGERVVVEVGGVLIKSVV